MTEPGKIAAAAERDFGLRIGRDGTWYYQESPIQRAPLVKLFASILSRDAEGKYWLTTPVEHGRITVDDVPFIAVEMEVQGAGREQVLTFRTNIDERVEASQDRPIRVETARETQEPAPYILVRPGLEARINRSVFYQLVELGAEADIGNGPQFGVWSHGAFFPLAA